MNRTRAAVTPSCQTPADAEFLHSSTWLHTGLFWLLPLLLWLGGPLAAQAQYTYITNNGAITITKYNGSGGTVAIPDTIDGLPVTSLGDMAFSDCYTLYSVTIPNSVTNLGINAFFYCISLTNVTIGSGVTDIGLSAFRFCSSLTAVAIPTNVTSIGVSAFSSCPSLSAITVATPNPAYSSVDGVLFNKSQNTLIQCPGGRAGSYAVSNSVVTIGNTAFNGCALLASVTIPDSVTSIGYMAFYDCASLASATIGNSVTSMGDYAFSTCRSLTNVMLPNSLSSIGEYAFDSCASLAGITLPTNLTSIGHCAFYRCTRLAGVTIPKNVTSIAVYAFSFCTNLTAMTVDALNPSYSSSLDGVLFNKSKTTLLQYPGGKTGNYTVPNSVTRIGDASFYGCSGLTGVTIPNSVSSIGYSTFSECSRLAGVAIPNSVTNIGNYAFYFCTSLTNIMLPASVAGIGMGAFSYCTSLTGIFFRGNAPTADPSAFQNANKAIVCYLPGTTGWGPTLGGRPVALWNPHFETDNPAFGVRTNRFGFTVAGTTNIPIVLEACTNLTGPVWEALQSCTLTNGELYFGDPDWTNSRSRFYRIRWP